MKFFVILTLLTLRRSVRSVMDRSKTFIEETLGAKPLAMLKEDASDLSFLL